MLAHEQGFDRLALNQVGIDQIPKEIASNLKAWNRYKNILPNPHSRVVLSGLGNNPSTKCV
jgi:protein tyrosine phosphatase